jgi:hypothetical protein
MSQSKIILDYQGPIDLQVIESLLKKIKKKKEFTALPKTTGKRTYALFVECLENIYKHSELKSSKEQRFQPHVSVMNGNNVILIKAGNPVQKDTKDYLVRKLDQVNQSDVVELKALYENKISSESLRNGRGAGLGFIFMTLRSGNKINYSFNPLTNDYLYFEIQISLNKYIMRKLIIDQTSCSPKVILDPEKRIYHISGESRPPDVREFYDQVLSWLDDFSVYSVKSHDPDEPTAFNFNFEYFNSSSGKLILDICKTLARLRSQGINITINWHFEKDDRIVKFPFEYVETEVK